MKRDLGFAHLGNGISVYDRLHEEHGDYQNVAHIDRDRNITFKVELKEEYKAEVEEYAATADPNISFTQEQKVFTTRPAQAA